MEILPARKPFYVLSVMILTTFFLLEMGYSRPDPVSFNFTNFIDQSSITLQGSAKTSTNGVLTLTTHQPSRNTGRALYTKPVPIWDSTTGTIASFVTSFSFIVEDVSRFVPADGLIIFFLAPLDTKIPINSAAGGKLGVVDGSDSFNQFVGVEFDGSHVNDPHIGIDVNSLISLKAVTWNRVSGLLVKVNIIYDALSKTLSVAVTNGDGLISTVAQVVDLKAVLPEKVRVGLSATTTEGGCQKHNILSWSFTSNSILDISENKYNLASYA